MAEPGDPNPDSLGTKSILWLRATLHICWVSNNYSVSTLCSCSLQTGLEREQTHQVRAGLSCKLSKQETAGLTTVSHPRWGFCKEVWSDEKTGAGAGVLGSSFRCYEIPGKSINIDEFTLCAGHQSRHCEVYKDESNRDPGLRKLRVTHLHIQLKQREKVTGTTRKCINCYETSKQLRSLKGHRRPTIKEGAGLCKPPGPLILTCSDSTDLEEHGDQVLFWLTAQVHWVVLPPTMRRVPLSLCNILQQRQDNNAPI